MGMAVNVANGNLVFEADDLKIPGVTVGLQVSRFWNSQATNSTRLGPRWSLSVGDGVSVTELSPGGNVLYRGPSGYAVKFTNPHPNGFGGTTYDTPEGFDAVLNKMSDGTFQLKFKDREERYDFDTQGRFTQDLNLRSDQKITYAYQSTTTKLDHITDTQNRVVNFNYYSTTDFQAGDPRIGRLKSITESNGPSLRTWSYEYDPSSARLTTYTDPNGGVTSYFYDSQGRLQAIKDPDPPDSDYTHITYVSNDPQSPDVNRVASITRVASRLPDGSFSDVGGFTTSFNYNATNSQCAAADNITKVDGPRTTVGDVTTYCVDDKGEVDKVLDANGNKRDIVYSSTGNVNFYGLASGNGYLMNYDTSDRLQKVTDPTGAQWTLSYDSGNSSFRPDHMTDPQGNTIDYGYTTDGFLSSVSCHTGGPNACPGGPYVTLDWNDGSADDTGPKGTLKTATDGRGNTTKYFYGPDENLSRIEYPKSQSGATLIGDTHFEYDGLGRPKFVTDGNGIRHRIDYDAMDRPLAVVYPALNTCLGQDRCDSVAYTYDYNGNLIERDDNFENSGRPQGTDQFIYDQRNLLTDSKLRQGVQSGREVVYSYDNAGNLATMENKAGLQSLGTTTYTYNKVNLVSGIIEPNGVDTFNYTYNDQNQPKTITYPATTGLTSTYNYTANHRLQEIKVTRTGTQNPLVDLQYQSNIGATPVSLVTRVTDLVANRTTDYSYADPLNRLTQATESGGPQPHTYSYQYDDASNMTRETVDGNATNYGYNAVNQLITVNGTITDSYDQNGNLTSMAGGKSFDYDHRNRTVGITPQGGSEIPFDYADIDQTERIQQAGTQYTDSVLGMQVQTASDGSATNFLRNPDTGAALEMDRADGDYYYLLDQFGSVAAMTNSQGNVVAGFRYEPYGKTVSVSPNTGPFNPIRFQNQFYDVFTGLYKMGTRYYDPSVGRWTQLDPMNIVEDPRRGNLYAFAEDDPVNGSDPSGASAVGPYECSPYYLSMGYCPNAYSETAVAYSPVGVTSTSGGSINCEPEELGLTGVGVAVGFAGLAASALQPELVGPAVYLSGGSEFASGGLAVTCGALSGG